MASCWHILLVHSLYMEKNPVLFLMLIDCDYLLHSSSKWDRCCIHVSSSDKSKIKDLSKLLQDNKHDDFSLPGC